MSRPAIKVHAINLKQLIFSRPFRYALWGIILATSIYFFINLYKELTIKNYGFYGTHYDFLAFYSAGKTVLNHNIAHLYDMVSLTSLQRQIIPHPIGAAGYMPFLNPPFMAVFLAPLALLNINTARLLWLVISLGLAIFIILKLVKPLQPKQKLLAVALLLFTFPLYQTFIEGQLSILVLLSGTVSYFYFKRRQKLLSGASLVLLWILPQFGILVAIGLIARRQWQMLKGWLLSSLALVLVALPITGLSLYIKYVKLLAATTNNHFMDMNTSTRLTWRGSFNTASGLNGFYDQLIGPGHTKLVNILFIVTSLVLVAGLFFCMKKAGRAWSVRQEALFYIAAVLIACLIDPHLFAQDVIVIYMLLPALFILYKRYTMNVVILFAALCNLVLIDQYSRLHFFTLLAIFLAIYYLYKSKTNKKARTI